MNLVKNSVALVAFVLSTVFAMAWTGERLSSLSGDSALLLLLSGLIGLGVGDYFLFRGYQRLGSARTIMVFSFSPVFLTFEGFFFFHQSLSTRQLFAILLMMACVWTISFEKFRERGKWEWHGILFALLGVLLDNVGVVLSRQAFDLSPGTSAITANAVRCLGGVGALLVWQHLSREKVFRSFGRLEWRDRSLVIFASFMGTFLSLALWLTALKVGHIGSLAGVGSFNPVSASLWEWVLLRKRPTLYLVAALLLFLSGFFLLLSGT
jgi:drug/metabolite transporter (DMT)-like permease